MIVGVADTHTVLWYLFADPRLSVTARDFIQRAAAARQKIAVSTISLAEVVYLADKNRLVPSAYNEVIKALADPDHVFAEAPLTAAIVEAMRSVPRTEVPEMPDRIIAATATYFSVPVLSRDRRIRAASINTIW